MDAATAVYLIEPPVFVASLMLLVWISLPRANPLWATLRPVVRVFTRKNYLLFVAAALLVVAINSVLTGLDAHFTRAVVGSPENDFTSFIWSIEGSAGASVQRLACEPLTWLTGWAYVIVFPLLLPWAAVVFDRLGQSRKNLPLLIAYVMNYVLVLPFYILFPVREAHAFSAGGSPVARLLLDDIHPVLMQTLRLMSGIDNCFPSFHTSLAVTVALFALHSGRKAFAAAGVAVAALIAFSTLYLGVHWVSDVAAGVVVGVLAWRLGERCGRRHAVRPYAN